MICLDMFFLGKNNKFINFVEPFSGYCGCFQVASEHASLIKILTEKFIKEIEDRSKHKITTILSDAGSENKQLKNIDGTRLIFATVGRPVAIIERYNGIIARKLSIYIDLIDDFSTVLPLVINSMNTRKFDRRGGFTPISILQMNKKTQQLLSKKTIYSKIHQHKGLKNIYVGDHVRILSLTYKESQGGKIGMKGYDKKWSIRIHTVKQIVRQKGQIGIFRYQTDLSKKFFYRNQLLKIPKQLDETIPIIQRVESKIYEDPRDMNSEYIPQDEESSDYEF